MIRTTDYRYKSRPGPLFCFASTNSWFVTKIYQNLEVCNSGIDLNYKTLISSSCFTASHNGTTRQADESWCLQRFRIPFRKIGFNVTVTGMRLIPMRFFLQW